MKIVLIRHGKPTFDLDNKVGPKALASALRAYDLAGIEDTSQPSSELCALIRTSAMVFTSDLRRSLESAQRLNQQSATPLALFREIPVPDNIPIPFQLRAISWAVIGRILWYLGYTGGIESRAEAHDRADKAAQQLMSHASDAGPVVLIGHGLMNLFIAKSLQQHGWHSPAKITRHYWSWSVFQPRYVVGQR